MEMDIEREIEGLLTALTFSTDMGHPGPMSAGTPLLKIPAFFFEISSTVEPNMRVWSSADGDLFEVLNVRYLDATQ